MQLSSQARKAMAAGLAASTILWSAAGVLPQIASAAVHSEGCLVLSGGTVWMITGGTRRGYTSAEVFQSWGRNFSEVVTASAEDVALPVGPIQVYADGTLLKGPNDPLVYLVAGGQKRPFTSGSVFTGLGFSFANIQSAPVNTFQDLPTGSNLDSTTIAHPAGVQVISNGAIWWMDANGRRGFSSAAQFNSYGYMFSHVVAANSYDLALPNLGDVPNRPACTGGSTTPPPTAGSVTLASDNPAASTLISGSTVGTSQAQADLAHFQFGSLGTVSSLTFERIGVSSNSTLTNVYLFDGATRLTDSASVGSNNMVTFAGLSLSTPRNIAVKADVAASVSGQTIGMKLVGYTANGTVYNANVAGNIHTVASASTATVAIATASGGGATDAGADLNVWQGTLTVGTRDVLLNRLALRQIGSISTNDIRNFRLQVDGIQVATVANLDSNGYVTFSPNTTLKSGTRIVKVLADIVGGSGRTYGMSLRGAYDLTTTDSQYNVGVNTTGTFPFGPAAANINAGTLTVAKATDSPSANLVAGATDVSVGKWTFTAYGESVKVETLKVGVDTDDTDSTVTFRNVRVLVNGSQVGSTTDVPAADAAATGTSFTTNFYVNPGTPVTVEVRSDMYDSEGGEEIGAGTLTTPKFSLVGGTTNAVPQVSLTPINVPSSNVDANQLTIATGSMSLTRLASYPNQTTAVPQTAFKLGQWSLTGSSSEAININTFAVGFVGADAFDPSDDLTNVYIKYGSNTSSIKGTVSDGSISSLANTWSQSTTLGVNENMNVELWGTIASTAFDTTTTADTIIPYLRVTGVTAQSGQTVYADVDSDTDGTDNGNTGQTTTASSGSLTTSEDAANPVAALNEDNKTFTAAAFKFTAANDSFNITELTLGVNAATTVSNVIVKANGATVATRAGATSLTISGLNIPVTSNSTKTITVDLQLGTVGSGAGTSGENVKVTMTAYKATNSSGTQKTNSDESGFATRSGTNQYVFAAIPVVAAASIPNVDPVGTFDVGSWTVTPTGGSISLKQFGFASVLTEADADSTLTLGSFKFFRDGTDITDLVSILNAAGATIEATNTLAEGSTVGYVAFDTEEQISSARTYTLRATIGGAPETGDSVRIDIGSDATSTSTKYLDSTNSTTGPFELATAGGASDTGALNFIWSDLSAIPHLTTVTSADDATPDSSGDWNNGFLVKNLPLPSFTLTY